MKLHALKKSWSRKFHWLKRHPRQWVRITAGVALIVGGILGPVTPVLGAWMLPFGVVLLVANSPVYWRARRRFVRWRRERRFRRRQPARNLDGTPGGHDSRRR